jgi:hypothetical protein
MLAQVMCRLADHRWGAPRYTGPNACTINRICERCSAREVVAEHSWGEWRDAVPKERWAGYEDGDTRIRSCPKCGSTETTTFVVCPDCRGGGVSGPPPPGGGPYDGPTCSGCRGRGMYWTSFRSVLTLCIGYIEEASPQTAIGAESRAAPRHSVRFVVAMCHNS